MNEVQFFTSLKCLHVETNISRLMKLETAMEETKTALEKLQMMYNTETNQKMVVITRIQKQVDEFNATLKSLQRTYDAQNMKVFIILKITLNLRYGRE